MRPHNRAISCPFESTEGEGNRQGIQLWILYQKIQAHTVVQSVFD